MSELDLGTGFTAPLATQQETFLHALDEVAKGRLMGKKIFLSKHHDGTWSTSSSSTAGIEKVAQRWIKSMPADQQMKAAAKIHIILESDHLLTKLFKKAYVPPKNGADIQKRIGQLEAKQAELEKVLHSFEEVVLGKDIMPSKLSIDDKKSYDSLYVEYQKILLELMALRELLAISPYRDFGILGHATAPPPPPYLGEATAPPPPKDLNKPTSTPAEGTPVVGIPVKGDISGITMGTIVDDPYNKTGKKHHHKP